MLLLTHVNAPCDVRVLRYEMHRHGISADELRARRVHVSDTLAAARAVKGTALPDALPDLYEQVTGKVMVRRHAVLETCRAIYDVAHNPPLQAAAQIECVDTWLLRTGEMPGKELYLPVFECAKTTCGTGVRWLQQRVQQRNARVSRRRRPEARCLPVLSRALATSGAKTP